MSKTPKYDAKVKKILDEIKSGERICALTGETWMMDEEEISWYRKFNVPPGTWHPMARLKITAAYATGFGWWWNKHANTGERLLSYVHPATGLKVLPDPEFFDSDFTDKAIEYDLNQSFNDQIRALQLTVPFTAWRSLIIPENSIALLSQGDQNSYFVTACKSKNSLYSYSGDDIEDSAEVSESSNIRGCYSVLNSHRLHNCRFIRQSYDLLNCDFMFDSRNCENCFMSSNQRNKKYMWFNEQLSKGEWEERRSKIDLGSRNVLDECLKKFHTLLTTKAIWPENFNEQTEGCVGEFINKSENCKEAYFVRSSKNNFWVSYFLSPCENNAFCAGGGGSTDNYYSHSPFESSGCKFTHSCYRSQNLEYCMQCYNCEDCFGCVGLNRKRFCIFNKQYSEEEYWKKLDEIKTNMLERGEYGDFFPLSYSPSYFFASPALAYLIDQSDVNELGADMYDLDSLDARGKIDQSITPKSISDLPDHINDFNPDEWSGVQIQDEEEGKRFSYIKPELNLYKQLGVAPPLMNPMLRLRTLIGDANSAIPIEEVCAKTGKNLRVAKNANYPERTIYCREEYLKFIEENN